MVSAMDSDPSDLDFDLAGASYTVMRGVPDRCNGRKVSAMDPEPSGLDFTLAGAIVYLCLSEV